MKEYVICTIFWMVFTIMVYGLGRAVTNGEKSESYSLLTGYLVYNLPVSAGGIIIQLSGLPWICFAVYLAVIWAALIGYMIYVKRKNSVKIFYVNIKQFLINNWVLLIILAVLAGMLFFYYRGFWLGDHLDDGYYITKVATIPYTNGNYAMNYSVGVPNSGFDSYIFNTWELEASVYVKLLGVTPTLFLRLFQSIFYYILFLSIVKGFAENILGRLRIAVKPSIYQLPAVITLLFGMYYVFLSKTSLLPIRDTFHFNTGMFLGVSLVKAAGILLLLYYFLDVESLNIKMLFATGALSVILISKSSVILPIIVVTASSFFFTWLMFQYGKREKFLGIAFLGLYFLLAFLMPGKQAIQDTLYSDIAKSVKSPVIIISVVILLCGFALKERIINRINMILLFIIMFMAVPKLNHIFELFSVYSFVAGRAYTTWVYSILLISAIELCVILMKIHVKLWLIRTAYAAMGIVLIVGIAYGFDKMGGTLTSDDPVSEGNVKNCLHVIWHNKDFIPNSTMQLGEVLEKLSHESGEKLYVVAPQIVGVDGTSHALSVILRTFAPDIVSVSAAVRFPVNNGSALSDYKQETYDAFVEAPDEKNSEAFEKEISKVGTNCVVVQNPECAQWMEKMGYELYSVVGDNLYYVWYRKS